MAVNDDLGMRMKENYEKIPQTKLMRRTPVAIRIDGKAFHTLTKGFKKPFDEVLMKSMQDTTKYLCENIQGCVFGYTQSDEITLILVDYKQLNSAAWFDYEVQKVCSIAASMATMAFNKFFADNVANEILDYHTSLVPQCVEMQKEMKEYHNTLNAAIKKGAMFDARCFNIPKEEVCNLIYWRQLDATRNSIQMVGQANFTHKELQGKSCSEIQEMLFTQRNINWDKFPIMYKRGTSCIKMECVKNGVTRKEWVLDELMPILKGDNREYVDKLIMV